MIWDEPIGVLGENAALIEKQKRVREPITERDGLTAVGGRRSRRYLRLTWEPAANAADARTC
jgi:hypothetical protein